MISKFNSSDKYTKYSAIIIILFSIIVLSLTSIYHVSGDGCWHVSASKFIAENRSIPLHEPLGRNEPFWSPPLYHLLAAFVYFVFNLFSHDIANFAIKFISPIFGILSLIVSFLLIKKLYNSKMAFYSVIFLAFVPIFIDYSVLSYVESMLTFFVVLSIYFIIMDRIWLSGMAAGLASLTKYNGLFVLPVLFVILYKRHGIKKRLFSDLFFLIIPVLVIAWPWLIRNWIILGNPVWPFLNLLFDGYHTEAYAGLTGAIKWSDLFSLDALILLYLGIFGVPDGNYHSFAFLNVPFMQFAILIWLAATLVFILPLIMGLMNLRRIKSESKIIFVVWIASYVVLMVIYIINASPSTSRIILPAFPALALFWAFGFMKVLEYKNIGMFFPKILSLIIIGFVFTLAFKVVFAVRAWDFYQKDFDWVKQNTPQGSIFIANGQCMPYNIERTSLYAENENFGKADYIWVNQKFILDKRSIYEDKTLDLITKNYNVAYSNRETGTTIYKVKH